MPSGTFYPAVSGDNGHRNSSFFEDTLDYCVIGRGTKDNDAWLRFANVTIPQGSTITAAFMRLKCHQNQSGTAVNTNIYFNDHDNAVAPTDDIEFGNLVKTTAFTPWDAIATWTDGIQYDTPSLVDELQEIVNRGSFASGNAVMAIIYNDGSDDAAKRLFSAIDFDGGSEKPELHVEWSAGNIDVPATTQSLTLTENPAIISYDLNVQANTAPLTVTANQAIVVWGIDINTNVANLLLSENPATIIHNIDLLAECATLTITPNAANVNLNVSISATSPSLIITSNAATVALSIKGTLALKNSLKVGSTLSLVNSLNVVFNGDITLALDILSKIEGSQTLRNDIENLAKFNDTLSLINHILGADSGVTVGGDIVTAESYTDPGGYVTPTPIYNPNGSILVAGGEIVPQNLVIPAGATVTNGFYFSRLFGI